MLRESAGWEVTALLDLSAAFSTVGSEVDLSAGLSPKLNLVLVPVGAGLMRAGERFLRKSR